MKSKFKELEETTDINPKITIVILFLILLGSLMGGLLSRYTIDWEGRELVDQAIEMELAGDD